MRFVVLSLLFPSLALANVTRPIVNTSRLSPRAPARYVMFAPGTLTIAHNSPLTRYVYPYTSGARLVDVVVIQSGAGTVGTSWTLQVRKASDATTMLTTAAAGTLASGAYVGTDAKGVMSLPAGWTRPVVKTTADAVVSKGTVIDLYTTEVGAYTVHPALNIALVFEPLD